VRIKIQTAPRRLGANTVAVKKRSGLVNKQTTRISRVLESLYARYNHRHFIKPDPLQFVYNYSAAGDMEIAAFLAAALAYGRVRQIEKSLTDLFERMGPSPGCFTRNFDARKRAVLKDFKHRFTSGDDISDLLDLFKKVLTKRGSIENFFAQFHNPHDKNIIPALSEFCDTLMDMHVRIHKSPASRGLRYLLSNPAAGSACKRLNLFLRWMVRDDDVDPGLWKSIDKGKLIVPVDVHMARLCTILGFYNQKTVSLKTAVTITRAFAQIEPADPVKYDFALSRVGILENCTGARRPECADCEILEFCLQASLEIAI